MFKDVEIEHVPEQITLSGPSSSIANPDRMTNSKEKRHIAQLMIKTNGNGKKEPVLEIEYKPQHTKSYRARNAFRSTTMDEYQQINLEEECQIEKLCNQKRHRSTSNSICSYRCLYDTWDGFLYDDSGNPYAGKDNNLYNSCQ